MADSTGFNWNGILETGLGALGGSLINGSLGLLGQDRQLAKSKELLDYQWNKMYSPLAQVKNLAAAGVNPAAAFGNNAPVLNSGGQLSMPDNPFGGLGTSSLTDISNYLLAKANAKKAGADTRKADAEADAVSFENELNRVFKQPERVSNLMSAYKSIQLQDDEHSRNEWINAKEKALSELTGIQKDTAEKVFNNMDTQIKLENKQREEDIILTQEKQKTEKSGQSANYASANASNASARLANAQASTEDALRDLKKFAIDLGNHMQGLEYGFNLDTYQTRLEKFANEAGIIKWTAFLNEIEAKDREAYNAVQRLIMGKGTKEDGKTLWNFINSGRQLIPFK